LSTTITKLAINQLWSQNFIQNVHCHGLNTRCRDDATTVAAQWHSRNARDDPA